MKVAQVYQLHSPYDTEEEDDTKPEENQSQTYKPKGNRDALRRVRKIQLGLKVNANISGERQQEEGRDLL